MTPPLASFTRPSNTIISPLNSTYGRRSSSSSIICAVNCGGGGGNRNRNRNRNTCSSSVGFQRLMISCEVALRSDSTTEEEEDEEMRRAKIGARIRVKVPLKVFHVPRVPEIDITGMEGVLKQYVALWKGKRISANLPFKVEFLTHIDARGPAPVKFFAHLKEDEFEYVDHI